MKKHDFKSGNSHSRLLKTLPLSSEGIIYCENTTLP